MQGLTFYYIQSLNNLFNVFQVAISFYEETILLLKNVVQLASICQLQTLLLCSDPLHKVEDFRS